MVVGLDLFGQVQRRKASRWLEGPRKRRPKEGPYVGFLRRCFQPGLPSREHCEWKGNLARYSGAQHRRLHENHCSPGSLNAKVLEKG